MNFEMPEGRRPVGRPVGSTSKPATSSGNMKSDDFAFLISAVFGLYGQSKPIYLREAWNYKPEDCQVVAEKLIVCIKQLPTKYADTIDRFAAPAGLVVAVGVMINNSAQREKEIHAHITRLFETGQATREQLAGIGFRPTGTTNSAQTRNNPVTNNSGNGHREKQPIHTDTNEFPAEFFDTDSLENVGF